MAGGSALGSVTAMPLGYHLIESRLVSPGANTDGDLGITPTWATYAWIYVDSGSVYAAYGEVTDVATGTSGGAVGNCLRLPSGGVPWPLDDITEGDGKLHVQPTAAVSVEVAFCRDAD